MTPYVYAGSLTHLNPLFCLNLKVGHLVFDDASIAYTWPTPHSSDTDPVSRNTSRVEYSNVRFHANPSSRAYEYLGRLPLRRNQPASSEFIRRENLVLVLVSRNANPSQPFPNLIHASVSFSDFTFRPRFVLSKLMRNCLHA
jgi:hypothetical protein